MTEKEWLEIGYDKGIIDCIDGETVLFCDVWKNWFCMKKELIKPQSIDRIEVCYNRWYLESALTKMPVNLISDSDLIKFLQNCLVTSGEISAKEISKILQIMTSVLQHARDLEIKGVGLHDWIRIKQSIPANKILYSKKKQEAISNEDIRKFCDSVIKDRIWEVHQNCCLLLCMNFYMGLRVGELASLTWSDFDFEKKVVRITKTESKFYKRNNEGEKTGSMVYRVTDSTKTVYSTREIPMLPEVRYFYDLIRYEHVSKRYDSEYLAYDGTEGVFVRALDRCVRRVCRLACIPYFSTHVIRKTVATKLHFHGTPTRVISDLLGHHDIVTTESNYILNYKDQWDIAYEYMHKGLVY